MAGRNAAQLVRREQRRVGRIGNRGHRRRASTRPRPPPSRNGSPEDQFLDQLDNAANMPFPASQKVLDDPRYVEASSEFLGGQKPGELYIASSEAVNPDWQFLPYQLYANTIYKDTFGQHVDGDHDLMAGLKAWQEKIVAYGTDQGFNVTSQ